MIVHLSDEEVAVTGFHEVFEENPVDAEERLIRLLGDPRVARLRHAFLTKLEELTRHVGLTRSRSQSIEDFSNELSELNVHGLFSCLESGKIQMPQLFRMVSRPQLLERTFEAVLGMPLFAEAAIPDSFQRVAEQLRVVAPVASIAKSVPHRTVGAIRLGSLSGSVSAGFTVGFASRNKEQLQVPVMKLSADRKRLKIQVPMKSESIEFPYRVAILQFRTDTGYECKKVFFVSVDESTGMYFAEVPVDLTAASPKACYSIDVWIVSDNAETESGAPSVDIDELDDLLKKDEVKIDSGLRAGLIALKTVLETR